MDALNDQAVFLAKFDRFPEVILPDSKTAGRSAHIGAVISTRTLAWVEAQADPAAFSPFPKFVNLVEGAKIHPDSILGPVNKIIRQFLCAQGNRFRSKTGFNCPFHLKD